MKSILAAILLVATPALAANRTVTCDASLQALGACTVEQSGQTIELFVYGFSTTVEVAEHPSAPADRLMLAFGGGYEINIVCTEQMVIDADCAVAQLNDLIPNPEPLKTFVDRFVANYLTERIRVTEVQKLHSEVPQPKRVRPGGKRP